MKIKIIDRMMKMNEIAVSENRTFNSVEEDEYRTLEAQLDEIEREERIKEKQERRSQWACQSDNQIQTRKDDTEMKDFQEFLLNRNEKTYVTTETRDLVGTTLKANNENVVPTSVAQQVIQKMVDQSDLLRNATIFNVGGGKLSVPRETTTNLFECGFCGEAEAVQTHPLTFDVAKLEEVRVGASCTLTNQMIFDSGAAIVDYTLNLLVRRMTNTIEKNMLRGDKEAGQFSGLLNDENLPVLNVSAIDADTLVMAIRSFHPSLLDGAVMLMNRETYKKVSVLKSGTGDFLMVPKFVEDTPKYMVNGTRVVVSEHLNDDEILLVNPKAIGVLIARNITVHRIDSDHEAIMKGIQTFCIEAYLDLVLINPDGALLIKAQA